MIRNTITLILTSLGVIYCTFMIGFNIGELKGTQSTRTPIHAVDFYPVDPDVNRNLGLIRPYIELCLQNEGAWIWQITPQGILRGACTEGIQVEGNQRDRTHEEAYEETHDEKEIRSY